MVVATCVPFLTETAPLTINNSAVAQHLGLTFGNTPGLLLRATFVLKAAKLFFLSRERPAPSIWRVHFTARASCCASLGFIQTVQTFDLIILITLVVLIVWFSVMLSAESQVCRDVRKVGSCCRTGYGSIRVLNPCLAPCGLYLGILLSSVTSR